MADNILDNTSDEIQLTQEEKYDKVLRYLKKEHDDSLEEHRETVKKINFLENKTSEIYKVISLTEKDMDPNFSLFSPVVTSNGRMNDNLYEEVHEMENELQQVKFNEKKIFDRLSYISENIQCIEYAKDNYKKETDNNNVDTIDTCNTTENSVSEDDILETNNIEDTIVSEPKNQVKNSKLAILESHENERARIAMELHDSVVQNLTSLIHKTELCTKLADKDTIRTKLELQTMISTLKSSINEIRSIIYNLKPMSLDDLGLKVTLERYIKQLSIYSDFAVTLNIEDESFEENLSNIIAVNLLRIIQEACNNAIKHSKGKRIDINITNEEDNLIVKITDDGEGYSFDEEDNLVVGDESFGIEIMKERAQLLSGNIEFINSETNNASVIVTLPLK